jgi:hypothetical protein
MTIIIVWEPDDPARRGDPRYWWDTHEVARLRQLSADLPDLEGKPKGQPLASLREEADGETVQLHFPGSEKSVRLSLTPFRDADPHRTYVIIEHRYSPTEAEQGALKVQGPPWRREAETMRQAWHAATVAGDDDRAAKLWEAFDTELRKHGFRTATEASPWNPRNAAEVQPGIFLQDERPTTTHVR